MATVYLGRATGAGGFERLVAIKVCHMHLREQPGFVSMFLDEARLAARIHHPNVVPTLDVRDEDELYIVMEYVEGGHLAQILRAVPPGERFVPVPIVLRIVHDALEGLHAAHELTDARGRPQNLVHRDVSPQNLLVGVDGITRIADFGVARAEERAAQTQPGEVKGKYSYMAPEQLRGLPVDRRADVFSASVVLWEALAGARLFKGSTSSDTMALVLSGPVRKPSTLREGIPPELDAAVKRGLERIPARRFASARELAESVARCGVELASTGDVAGYVSEVLADTVEAHRRVICDAASPAREERSAGAHPEGTTVPDPSPRKDASTVASSFVRVRSAPLRRALPFVLAAALLLILGLGLWLGTSQRRPEAAQPASTGEPRWPAPTPAPPQTSLGGGAAEGLAGADPSLPRAGTAPDAGATEERADAGPSAEPEERQPASRRQGWQKRRGGRTSKIPAAGGSSDEEPSFTRI